MLITHRMDESNLAKWDNLSGESLDKYGKVWANLARKAFQGDVLVERKQVCMSLEDSLTNPALSSMYFNYHIDHPKRSITDVLNYL